ncbi:MAG: CRISPR system precrRNA processing endoribonuclease RAMP protein Cas6 [Candidatus Lokiarchaeota archaeon]|nr:CRISPR system precrRNA processing endoribonuclease RAMP protein Cas6 [Candidatus Lokiarchaeota archaeon]
MITLGFRLRSPFSGVMDYTGVGLRAAFLNLLKNYDHELSGKVHDSSAVRSYSLTPFPCNNRFQTFFDEGEEYNFTVNLFDVGKYRDVLRHIATSQNRSLRLHHQRFPILGIDYSTRNPERMMEDWASPLSTYDKSEIHVSMKFQTPTQLSHFGSDKAYLLPDPEKIFSGLLKVWNTMQDATVVERTSSYRDWIASNVYIRKHNILTQEVSLGRKRKLIGFVGTLVFSIRNRSSPFLPLTIGLLRFAEYCNIGKNRTAGFGRVSVRMTIDAEKEKEGEQDNVHTSRGREAETTSKI